MKKALVLAGGLPQIALIEDLKSRGITTVLADYNENPVARKHADKFYQVSTLDVMAIENIAKEENVDFLITVCTDQALLTVAKVSETLGLPCYIDYETALNVTNKSYMKKVFVENGIPTAKHLILDEYSKDVIDSISYPLIVKPVDCNSSKGVKKVINDEELKTALDMAIKYSRTNSAVVEEYIEGVELSVDVYVEEGKARLLAVSQLDKISDNEKFIICRSKSTTEIASSLRIKIEQVAQQIADAFGLKNSPMLIQMINRNDNVYVLEFSARTGGGEKFITIKELSGFDVVKAVVDLTLGKIPKVKKNESAVKYCVSEFIYCFPGEFDHLEGFEEMEDEGIIYKTMLFKWKGATFDKIESSGDRVAGFVILGESKSEIINKHNTILSKVKVMDKCNRDIMNREIIKRLEL